jgi:hypothetical protein
MRNKLLGLVFLLCLFSCKEKVEQLQIQKEIPEGINQDEVRTISARTKDYDTLINRVKKRGDVDAYGELFYSFKDCCFRESTDSVMVYAKIMAEKFNYEKAYFDYFEAICYKYDVAYSNFSETDISKMDKYERLKLESWLKIMVEKKLITQQAFDSVKK